ncbi:flavin-containing monooxygenase [Amycolatopsis panacis]|uniref:NAD(P)/FAD-dependent oxidoreductase n=1 Tax=Amycolatopsis panacis TaxID=2340917 RepID=A0A419I2Y2_9PSEU|nr:NAD(P)/FAD-dependent oxidoreductase [Amycolatopsis panacis]RJQ84401.1 NAD(P)/FAD-dependent oxidoreductase [Amycolatopsis panacis]
MTEQFKVVIVGTGFSGLGQAIQLEKAGIRDYLILEKAGEVGGTWRDNSYPGCACDVQSHIYSFSFAQNPDWSRSFSPRQEIFEYLKRVADSHRLRERIRFGVEITGAHWDAGARRWTVETKGGQEFSAQFVVSGVGGLHIPQIPRLPGIASFQGQAWHSAQWNHEFDLPGKKVAVVGTGASAVQFVPQIAPEVAELKLFQRTPPWLLPKPDHPMPAWTRRVFRQVPGAQRLYRGALYWSREARALGFTGPSWIMQAGQVLSRRHIARGIKDPELRRKVTPDYTMGCKRVLLSNDYFPALDRPNVDVITDGVAEVRAHSVVDGAGVEHEVDAIIYGTGFKVIDALDYLDITGVDGRDLAKSWATEGARTHKGITVSGFPNLFFLLGPNTAVGHTSVIFMIEAQARYVVDAIRLADSRGAEALDVRESVQERFQEHLQGKLAKSVWTQGGCKSWYLDAKGINRATWPGFTWRYWLQTRRVEPSDYELSGRS